MARSTSNGNFANSTASSTGSRPKTTPTAAPTGSHARQWGLPPFLAGLLADQAKSQTRDRCACTAQHEGSGQYVFLGPDGGHYRRSNYARRVFRPACDGRYQDAPSRPARLVIADATIWPGTPIAAWPPAKPGTDYEPPRGHGITPIPEDTPLTCWLPIRPGLTPHGLRHSHKTWMAEDGIPEILAEQRLGHDVPGMRGLYAHASGRMRDDLKAALQQRWDDSLRDRAAIHPHSPVPLLDRLLAHTAAGAQETTPHHAPSTGRNQHLRTGEDDLPDSSQTAERPHPDD